MLSPFLPVPEECPKTFDCSPFQRSTPYDVDQYVGIKEGIALTVEDELYIELGRRCQWGRGAAPPYLSVFVENGHCGD